tara:strand:+ start:3393 stop:5087 length:1695 start_codon:yes stop_codon:yes gene_type:complete
MADAKQKLVIDVVAKNTAALGGVAAGLNGVKASALGAGTAMRVLGPLLAVLVTGKLIKDIVMTNSRFEDLRTTLSSVTGSAEEGAEAFDFISKFATKTQFGVEDLTKTFIKLKAAGITPTQELMTTFTDTAAITSDQIGSLEAVTDLFARTVSGGLGLEEIQRLGDRGVPVLAILEEKLGLSRNEISEFGKTAAGAAKITQAFTEGINERFGGSTQKLIENTSTKFSNLGIALKNAADDIGEKLKPAIGDTTVALTAFIEENEETITSIARFVGGALSMFVKVLGEVFSAVFKVVGAIAKLGNGIKDLLTFGKEEIKLDNKRIENLRKFNDAYKTSTKAIEVQVHAVKEAKAATEELDEKQKDLEISFNHNVTAQELLVSGMNSFNDAATSALTDVIFQAKTLNEALSSIVNVALRALVEGFIQLAVVTPILEFIKKFLIDQGILQDKLNSKLKQEIGLRTVLAFLTGGASIFSGRASGGPVSANTPYIVGERGPEMFVPNSSGSIVPNNQLSSGGSAMGGATNINFNINAVDAQGFDELLLSRKGLIIGTIQQAFRQQGRRFA